MDKRDKAEKFDELSEEQSDDDDDSSSSDHSDDDNMDMESDS